MFKKIISTGFPLIYSAAIFCKIAGVTTFATWSWWLLLAPIYAPVILWILFAIATVTVFYILTKNL